MAEFILRDMVRQRGLEKRFEIASAATSAEELGNPVYPPARQELARHGISCKGKTARQLTRADYGEYDWLKPGMSAEAEIIIDVINDALQAPVNAVHLVNGDTMCYVAGLLGTEQRKVKTGEFNISFIQILEGLEAGESILLRPPDAPESGETAAPGEGKAENGAEASPPPAENRPRERRQGKGENTAS